MRSLLKSVQEILEFTVAHSKIRSWVLQVLLLWQTLLMRLPWLHSLVESGLLPSVQVVEFYCETYCLGSNHSLHGKVIKKKERHSYVAIIGANDSTVSLAKLALRMNHAFLPDDFLLLLFSPIRATEFWQVFLYKWIIDALHKNVT